MKGAARSSEFSQKPSSSVPAPRRLTLPFFFDEMKVVVAHADDDGRALEAYCLHFPFRQQQHHTAGTRDDGMIHTQACIFTEILFFLLLLCNAHLPS